MSRRSSGASRAAYVGLLAASAMLMTAALFWLGASSRLAAVGVRMDRLNQERALLLQKRSDALVAYARATDPRVMEQRARDLGLAPAEAPRTLAVGRAPELGGGSGLGRIVAIRTQARGPAKVPSPKQAEGPLASVAARALFRSR